MQIGSFAPVHAGALARPRLAAEAGPLGAATRGEAGRGHHHGHDKARLGEGGAEMRMQARLQRLAALLQRLTEQNPQAMGASYAAIVTGGPGGALAVAATPSAPATPGDSLVIQAQTIGDVATGAGDDRVSLTGASVQGVFTGGGSDAVTIVASYVFGIRTDDLPPAPPAPAPETAAEEGAETVVATPEAGVASDTPVEAAEGAEAGPVPTTGDLPEPGAEIDTGGAPLAPIGAAPVAGGNDALSIAAWLISDIATGGGDDALALSGRIVAGVDAGAGNDVMAVSARIATGLAGGEGDDVIAVEARAGIGGLTAAASWFAAAAEAASEPEGTEGAVAAAGAQAARAYADVDGGAGNDLITVRTASVLAVAGGTGDDRIEVGDGTVALVYGAGDGDDRVNVAEGAQVVLQLAPEAGAWSVEFGDEGMTVRLAEGSITFSGIGAGTIGITTGDGTMTLVSGASVTGTTGGGLNLTL